MCLINFSKFQKTHVNFMKFAGKTMVALKYKKKQTSPYQNWFKLVSLEPHDNLLSPKYPFQIVRTSGRTKNRV